MTKDEHITRHVVLHQHLDELFADYIRHHPDQVRFLDMPFSQLMNWSHQQTILPMEVSQEDATGDIEP